MTRSRLNLAVAWAAATLCAHHAGAQSPASSPQPLPSRLPVAAPLAGPPTAPVAAPVAAPVSPEVPGAPEAASDLPAVRITGSALRRIDAETALPVTVLRRADIERSGARTTTELLQQLPQMQGYVRTTTVTGNDSFGYASASIHDLGDAYTLVLLNGLRVAPFAGQSASGALASVDLNTIPLAMVERIEVLNDGASALYGADALGGVVNIITRREGDANEASVGWTLPKGGAREWRASAFKSVGSIEQGGQNLSLGASAMHRSALPATQRSYANRSQIDLVEGGQRYRFFDVLLSTAPANIENALNPAVALQGACPAGQYDYFGVLCSYNFAADLDLIPEQDQHSLMASYTRLVGPDGHVQFDALLSRSQVISHLAPMPVELTVPASSAVYQLHQTELGLPGSAMAINYRLMDLGRRRFTDTSTLIDLALRLDGRHAGWAWQSALKFSRSEVGSVIAGNMGKKAAQSLIDNDTGFDPFLGAGQQTAAGLAALQRQAYRGNWLSGQSTLQEWQGQGVRDLAPLPGGPIKLALGANVRHERLSFEPSDFAQGLLSDPAAGTLAAPGSGTGDLRLGDSFALVPSTAKRLAWGAFAELLAPVQPSLDLTAAARADHDSLVGSALTGKASARWRATPTMLWRASVGTGFRSPTLNQLRSPAQSYGSTATEFACNAGLQAVATELGATPCNADAAYPQVFSGNSALKPERSLQGNLGLRIEPLPGHSIGVDLWALRLQDRIGSADQSLVFANPQAYPGLWTTVPGSSGTQLAYAAYPMNLGTGMSSGVDVDASVRRGSALGLFDSQLRVSAILRSVGKPYPGADWASSLGDGYYGTPTLKWRANWRTSFTRQGWTHSLTGRYQSGYTEAPVDVYVLDANGQLTGDTAKIRLKMPGQLLWDWQSTWQVNGTLQLTAGIVNVFNTKPPLSLYESDTTGKAQILGYDERYYDARGRMLTLEARLSF